MDYPHITVTHACMVSIFLSYGSPFILHVTLTTVITYTSDTQICYTDDCYTNMLHGYMDMIYGYTDIPWYTCIDCLYIFLLHIFPSCHPVTWLFPVTSIDILVIDILITGYECCWSQPREPPLESHISCISFLVILFHDINKAHVLLSYCLYCSSSWYTV